MPPGIATRGAAAEDEGFLYALFQSVRGPEFSRLALAPELLEQLLRMQYAGQQQTYAAQYPEGDQVILLEGAPIGRIWLYRGAREHWLVDISLLPEHRNRGIGGALVAHAAGEARAARVPLRSSVAVTNLGSLRFHQRLGFTVTGQDEVYCDLALEP